MLDLIISNVIHLKWNYFNIPLNEMSVRFNSKYSNTVTHHYKIIYYKFYKNYL